MRVLSVIQKFVVGVSLLGVSLVALPFAYGQSQQQNSATRGGLAGVVTDAVGAAIPNAKITVVGPQGTINTTSDGNGHYEVTGLTLGLYNLTVSAPGFSTFVSTGNEVQIDHTQTLNAKLAVGATGDTVTVEGGVTAIDTENTSVNTAITDTFYNAVPLPRNVSGVFYIAPGVVSGGGTGVSNPSIGGASGLENLYIADGVTITDQAFGGLGVYTPSYGSLGTGINLTFIKEVDIKTGAFEPKYGQADGGIIEIVTKSGSNQYHGAINAYVTPEFGFAGRNQLYQYHYLSSFPTQQLAQPAYEISAEVGGYVPGFREKLFFFGSFDPTLNRNINLAYPADVLFPGDAVAANPQGSKTLIALGPVQYNTTTASWAAKLTYVPFASTILEASSYGDPSRRNVAPATLATTSAPSVTSSYAYGTRNSILRVNTTVTPHITAFGAYGYNHANYHEDPLLNDFQISNRTNPAPISLGFGTYYKTLDNNYQLQGETQANYSFLGKHVTSIGYLYDHLDFGNSTLRSGPGYAIPSANAAGGSIATLFPTSAAAIGQQSNASFRLFTATGKTNGTTPGNQGCTYCANLNGNQVYLQAFRATYKGSVVSSISRYHAAYGNEVFTPEKHITINAGLRWEQQAYGGALLTYHWRDNWSPRLGITVDPFGDRKSKAFFSYSRYQVPLPLDAAIRQLGNEQDDTLFIFAPKKDPSGNAILDSTGAVIPDTSVALNGTQRCSTCAVGGSAAAFGAPSFSSSTGEGILPGTRMEEQDEYILGVSREIKPGTVLSVRYTDRHYNRIVEDIGSQSPEGSLVEPNFAGGIANVTGSTDLFVNEQEAVYTPAQFATANPSCPTPGSFQTKDATAPCFLKTAYVAPLPGCTSANDTGVGNGGFFTHPDGSPYNGSCITNLATAGALGGDGKPDGFADPRRHYQALEVELNRALRNHWQARINYRYAKLFGNYEGFFRNDNGQSDPGISSLFDFTQGSLGLLGDQFKRGYLNSDRRHVANVLIAYNVGKDTPFLGRLAALNGVAVGTYFHALSGTPLSAFVSHPIYGNAGEVPIGGRGTQGTTPVNLQLDMHLEDSYRIKEKYTIRGAFDGFNVTNSQPTIGLNQNLDLSAGVVNQDGPQLTNGVVTTGGKPTSFQTAFRARFKLAFEF
ncbi:MAG: carboxypeptidase regulatory-like domain-containing protein [Acidobacteriaceae bacterium]